MVPRWWDFAACKGMNTNDFVDYYKIEECLAVCARCPVVPECRDEAFQHVTVGVSGGLIFRAPTMLNRPFASLKERLEGLPVADLTRTPGPHGTEAAYQRHKEAGERPCESCTKGHKSHLQRIYKRRKEAKNAAN